MEYAEHRRVMTDVEDDVIIHVDWAEYRLVSNEVHYIQGVQRQTAWVMMFF